MGIIGHHKNNENNIENPVKKFKMRCILLYIMIELLFTRENLCLSSLLIHEFTDVQIYTWEENAHAESVNTWWIVS